MQLTRQLALVYEPPKDPKKPRSIEFRQLASVSAAIQAQITHDFSPIWEISATIDSFASLDDVPLGYWPIVVEEDIETPSAAGVHEDRMGQPFSLVQAGEFWSLTASHEALEMLTDPFGNRTVSGPPPVEWKDPVSSTVEYLVEVCDPCEDLHNSYIVNGLPVSDFYTPHYFDLHQAGGVRYDIAGKIAKPREVLTNGYLSWHSPVDDQWYQLKVSDRTQPEVVCLGKLTARGASIRAVIDAATPTLLEHEGLDPNSSRLASCGLVCVGCEAIRTALRSGRLLARSKGKTAVLADTPDGGSGPEVPADGLVRDAGALRQDIERIKKAAAKPATPPPSGKGRRPKK